MQSGAGMSCLILSLLLFVFSSLVSFLWKESRGKKISACGGVLLASLLGLYPSLKSLSEATTQERIWKWGSTGLDFAIGIDPLSAFFLTAILFVSMIVAIYSWSYLKGQPRLVAYVPFFPLLTGAMAAVVVSRDGFFFLIFWEMMSLASFFLVCTEHETRESRHAGWIYLIATHLATGFLMAFFILLFKTGGSFLFHDFVHLNFSSTLLPGLLFLFALIGFGTKAGLFPFHVWLPHAHPAAPSPISALMSGVMIKTGIYGILRALTFLGPLQEWWGITLMILGILSAVLGVLYALMQHDLKRLLAYHSVENIGIIAIGIGLGILGVVHHHFAWALLGWMGALFHVWNHSLFKSLLFLGAGNVIHTTHTRVLDQLGGLLKKMPATAACFLIASAAICGLPPLNGFISEWLIYIGLFQATQSLTHVPLFFSVAGIVGIAFAGGLALACFAKVFGVVFLGTERKQRTETVNEAPTPAIFSMGILALLCIGFGLFPQSVLPLLINTAGSLDSSLASGFEVNRIFSSLGDITVICAAALALFLLLFFCQRFIMGRRKIKTATTWGCGYTLPSSRMQYSAASFAEPLGTFFKNLLKPLTVYKTLTSHFPAANSFEEHADDLSERILFSPIFEKVAGLLHNIRKRQKSGVQAYLKLIFMTLIALLLWEVWFGI